MTATLEHKTSLPTMNASTPNRVPSAGATTSPRAIPLPTSTRPAPVGTTSTDRGQMRPDTHQSAAPVGSNFPTGQGPIDAQTASARGDSDSGTGAKVQPIPTGDARPSLFDPALYTLAQWLDDVEGLRKAQANRLRILTAIDPDEDGVVRGFGYDETHPVVAVTQATIAQLDQIEHAAILDLQRAMRKHPLNEWRKTRKGVGEKQLARLLAAIGDPYMRADTGQPRTVSQLWAYSGLHVFPTGHPHPDTQAPRARGDSTSSGGQPGVDAQTFPAPAGTHTAARRQKGVKANWSTDAKTRAYLIATSCIKQPGTEYRAVYDQRRERTAETHPDWTPGHSHNDALRILSKRILRDLWRAARDYHEGTDS